MNVAVCSYGAGNIRSVELAFTRLGATIVDDVRTCDLAVLPGVGSARTAMAGLRERGLDEALRERFEWGRPILGICLGLQLALEHTEEDGGVDGLHLLPGRAERIATGRVPRIGWAEVNGSGTFWFAHSYAANTPCAVAWSEGIVAEVRLGSFVGVQFHPEKSGAAGARFLQQELSCLSRV